MEWPACNHGLDLIIWEMLLFIGPIQFDVHDCCTLRYVVLLRREWQYRRLLAVTLCPPVHTLQHGQGTMTYCCPADNGVQEKYEGDWAEGRMHGRGSYWYVRVLIRTHVLHWTNSTWYLIHRIKLYCTGHLSSTSHRSALYCIAQCWNVRGCVLRWSSRQLQLLLAVPDMHSYGKVYQW